MKPKKVGRKYSYFISNSIIYDYTDGGYFHIKDKEPIKRFGTTDSGGYKVIRVLDKSFKAHRLFWFLYYGRWPKKEIDHINGNRSDNRIENLREVSKSENALNRDRHRNGRLPGSSLRKDNKKWRSIIYKNGKQINLGQYDTELEAHNAYKQKLKEL